MSFKQDIFDLIKFEYYVGKIFGSNNYTINKTSKIIKPSKFDDLLRLVKTIIIFYFIPQHLVILQAFLDMATSIKPPEHFIFLFLYYLLYYFIFIEYIKITFFERSKICSLFMDVNKSYYKLKFWGDLSTLKIRIAVISTTLLSYLPHFYGVFCCYFNYNTGYFNDLLYLHLFLLIDSAILCNLLIMMFLIKFCVSAANNLLFKMESFEKFKQEIILIDVIKVNEDLSCYFKRINRVFDLVIIRICIAFGNSVVTCFNYFASPEFEFCWLFEFITLILPILMIIVLHHLIIKEVSLIINKHTS